MLIEQSTRIKFIPVIQKCNPESMLQIYTINTND